MSIPASLFRASYSMSSNISETLEARLNSSCGESPPIPLLLLDTDDVSIRRPLEDDEEGAAPTAKGAVARDSCAGGVSTGARLSSYCLGNTTPFLRMLWYVSTNSGYSLCSNLGEFAALHRKQERCERYPMREERLAPGLYHVEHPRRNLEAVPPALLGVRLQAFQPPS